MSALPKIEVVGRDPENEKFKPEKVEVQKLDLSWEQLTSKGQERLERTKTKISGLKDSIKGGLGGALTRMKDFSADALRVALMSPEIVASAPEIGKHVLDVGKEKVQEGYNTVSNSIMERISRGKFSINKAYTGVIDGLKQRLNGVEDRALGAFSNFSTRVENSIAGFRGRVETMRTTKEFERIQQRQAAIDSLREYARQLGLNVSITE